MLFPYTFIAVHVTPDSTFVSVTALHDDDAGLMFNAWNRAENVYGADSQAVRAVWGRYLGGHAVACYVATSNADAERIALDDSIPEQVRAAAACLALGKPLGDTPKGSEGDGGTKARLTPPKPVKPSGGVSAVPDRASLIGL